MGQDIDLLLKQRFHGASNIGGIRYQILYSVLRSFDLYSDNSKYKSVRLEGIEDVDLLGLYMGNEYVQVKTSQKPWHWSKLKESIKNFLDSYRINSDCEFVLAVNFQLKKDIAKLSQIKSLSPQEKNKITEKFNDLCHQIGASDDEAEGIASRLSIISIPETQILDKLHFNIEKIFELDHKIVNIYLSVFVANFLDWAEIRKEIIRTDLDNLRISIWETLRHEKELETPGYKAIDNISWVPDTNVTDFFEGKETRPGHIVAKVDVRRPMWLEKIDQALSATKICILRSSSGQGKSTLIYQYAYEKWPAENTFILRIAELPEHVESVRSYLRLRAELGLPLLLLIDNAGWRMRLWPLVVQECAALGINVLITIRNEDWHRFSRDSLTNYEILEPTMDLNEAQQIFKTFQAKGKLHASIDSAEWAYERIGTPHLLIEYVYLLTHGRMLEERLRDQIRQISDQKEDPSKIEILRRVALADTLGAPVIANNLLQDIELRNDPQQILKSLSGEYLNLDAGIITGLHWVRSDHLAKILHEGYPNLESTALSIFEAISPERISIFVANAICKKGLDSNKFIDGLVNKAKNQSIDNILACLDGLFEGGERQFFEKNGSSPDHGGRYKM